MRARLSLAAATLVTFAGLLVSLAAFGELPILGTAFGAVLTGAVAGLVAGHPREGARGALFGGAGAVVALLAFAVTSAEVVPGHPIASSAEGVVLTQAVLLVAVPAPLAWLAGRLVAPPRPQVPEAQRPALPPRPRP